MLPKLSAFQEVNAQHFNKVVDAVNKVNDLAVVPPLELVRGAGRFQLRISEKGFYAAVTARTERKPFPSSSSGGDEEDPSSPDEEDPSSPDSSETPGPCEYAGNLYRYTVEEIYPIDCGGSAFKDGGRTTDHAWEWNDFKVDIGTVVWVEPVGDNDYRFFFGGAPSDDSSSSSSGSGTSDGSGSSGGCTPVTTCIPIVTGCEDGEITKKYLSLRNGQLCISDTDCNPSSSSSGGPCIWDGAGYYCTAEGCSFISDCISWAEAGEPAGPFVTPEECEAACLSEPGSSEEGGGE